LEAIFTSEKETMEFEILTGAALIVTGSFLSIFAILPADVPHALGPWLSRVYSSLTFGSLGALLLVYGSGIITFVVAQHETKLPNTRASPIDEQSEVYSLGHSKGLPGPRRMTGTGPRVAAIAFLQSLVLVALYSGFVQEFVSNLSMQIWVRSNFPVGQSILNWEGVLSFSVLLGLLLLQFLPCRFLSE
jgi:hypothetical protein